MYDLGYPNNNCIGCIKGGMGYWNRIRKDFPDIPIIATGGPTEEDILRTIQAGANAITYTPPSTGELFSVRMHQYRAQFHPE